jgi:hypothetical protein
LSQRGLWIVHVLKAMRTVDGVIRASGTILRYLVRVAILNIKPFRPLANEIVSSPNIDYLTAQVSVGE